MARRPVLVLAVALALVIVAPSRATVTEYPTCSLPPTADGALCADGRSPNSIVAGPDGAVWFTTYGGGEVGRITIAGAITLFNVPRPAGESSDVIRGPAGITAGPDGALWYVEDFGNRVGRVATDGTFTTYDVPGARPADIAVGPDSALWFTAAGTNSIGRITTTGSVSSFPLPAPGGASIKKLGGIVRGGDDRLWFAEVQGRKIGAIRTDGTLREYPLPAGVGTPYDLTGGPDGAVWFSLFDSDRIGRITPGGAMRFFHLPAGSGPSDLTFASDGGLWIGASGRSAPSAILRMRTSDGSLTPTPLLYASSVNGMAEGPDHAVWFTETGPNQIGRITTATTIVPVVTPVSPGPAATPVLIPPPAFAVPGAPKLTGGALHIGLDLSAPAAVELAAAVVRRHRPVILGRGSVHTVGAGKHTVRVKLTASGRRILARSRHPKVVVAARARGSDRRRATRERTSRLR